MLSLKPVSFKQTWALLGKESRTLVSAPSLWVMLMIESPLVGYGFSQAVYLYTQASRSALKFPELAKGMEPMQGVMVPTFGSLYLVLTLLFPFIGIRLMRHERDSHSLKLLVQTPVSSMTIVLAKFLTGMVAYAVALVPICAALVVWQASGGHVFWPAFACLVLGYALYAAVVCSIAFASSVITDSPTSAAILTLAATLGMWVLDFASGTTGLLRAFSFTSLTESLRQFETGLLNSSDIFRLLITATSLLAITTCCLSSGRTAKSKAAKCGLIISSGVLAALAASWFALYADLSEDHHNSFNPAFERALHKMDQPLTITINLSPDDSRLQEIEHNVLAKLRRNVKHLTVIYPETTNQALFTNPEHDKYGLIEYEYGGKKDEGRSNSPSEILPILFHLSGQTVEPDQVENYFGYPLVIEKTNVELLFYFFLPIAIAGFWWWFRLPPKSIGVRP